MLTEGYNTYYCNNIAPGETEKTYRKVGTHRKEERGKANRNQAQKDYARTYKQRKNHGKMSECCHIAHALDLVAQNGAGKLVETTVECHVKIGG